MLGSVERIEALVLRHENSSSFDNFAASVAEESVDNTARVCQHLHFLLNNSSDIPTGFLHTHAELTGAILNRETRRWLMNTASQNIQHRHSLDRGQVYKQRDSENFGIFRKLFD